MARWEPFTVLLNVHLILKVQDQLINVANFHNYLSSFGMFLPDQLFQEIFPYVQQGNKVKITENQLTFLQYSRRETIQLTPAEVVSLNITHFKLEKTNYACCETAY